MNRWLRKWEALTWAWIFKLKRKISTVIEAAAGIEAEGPLQESRTEQTIRKRGAPVPRAQPVRWVHEADRARTVRTAMAPKASNHQAKRKHKKISSKARRSQKLPPNNSWSKLKAGLRPWGIYLSRGCIRLTLSPRNLKRWRSSSRNSNLSQSICLKIDHLKHREYRPKSSWMSCRGVFVTTIKWIRKPFFIW